MHNFSYTKPASLSAAEAAISKQDSIFLAGGHTLIPTLKHRLAKYQNLIDLAGLTELRGIQVDPAGVMLGAMTTHAEVVTSREIANSIPVLCQLAEGIGDPQVRNCGTIGGSIANHDPNADWPAAILALDAQIITNRRTIAADDFFQGLFETCLEDGELIKQIAFPKPRRAAYRRIDQPASRYALVAAFVAESGDGNLRIAITGAGQQGVFRATDFEQALQQAPADNIAQTLAAIAVASDTINSDIHGSAEYRIALMRTMIERAYQAL